MPTLHETLAATAAAHGDAIAIRTDEVAITYAELDARVDAAAAALQAAGVGPGDRVALLLGNRPSFVVAFHAALRAGAVAVPINTALTSAEIHTELGDCRAAAIVIGRAFTPTLQALRGTLPALDSAFVADSSAAVAAESGMRSWGDALAAAEGTSPDPVDRGEDDLAVIAYTSGTSGTPRGVVLTHGQLLANQRQLAEAGMGVTPDDLVYVALPLFHIYALNVGMGMAVAGGAALRLVERFDPTGDLRILTDERVTVVVGAPPMYVAWLNVPGADEQDLSGVRLATSGAAPLAPRVLARCADELGLDVREGYGLTEAAPVVTTSAALPAAVPGSAGPPLPGVEVRIVDDGGPAEDGDPGRVQVRGPNVFSGYWERPEETARAVDADGWLDTGDVGYLADGNLHLVDRATDLIIVSGFNVYPVEVEAALTSHPAVIQAAAIGVPHPYSGEAVKAFVVRAEGAEVTADELIAHTAGLLARFKRPVAIEFVDDLPMLPTGKLRRRLLRP